MASIQDVIDGVNALNTEITDVIQVKLDAIGVLVAALKAGQVSQAQIDALAASVASAKTAADALSAEEDAINAP